MGASCMQCGLDIGRRHHSAKFCGQCVQIRAKTRKENKQKYCWRCGIVLVGTKSRNCDDCWPKIFDQNRNWQENSGKGLAHTLVARAKRSGLIPDLNAVYMKCSDCNEQATEYDHRDYNYPLLVSPVCRSCNLKRGSAIPHKDYKPLEVA